ncbi:MAG: DUF3187 family protein, partial [Proteobacteria bacterium]|nr:DUF3187 family protein [Pseudomonadota bacterium]
AQLLPGRVEARLDVPVYWRGAGIFDGLINGFHDLFGLPGGTKNDAPMNEYHYEISSGDDSYSADSGVGVGDAVVRFKREIPGDLPLGLRSAGRGSAKLPTGSKSRGYGSGSADASVGLVAAMGPERWSLFGAVDGVYLGGSPSDVIALDRHWALKASGGAGVKLWSLGELTAQIEYFTTPYDTGEPTLDRDVGMFTLGFQRVNASGTKWALGFTEDLSSRASPDFSAFLDLQVPF